MLLFAFVYVLKDLKGYYSLFLTKMTWKLVPFLNFYLAIEISEVLNLPSREILKRSPVELQCWNDG